jgi:hypothetical protein
MEPLIIQRGQSVKWRLALKDGNGAAINIAGATWVVEESPFAASQVSFETLNPGAGEIWFRVTRAGTRNIKPNNYIMRLVAEFGPLDAIAFPVIPIRVK